MGLPYPWPPQNPWPHPNRPKPMFLPDRGVMGYPCPPHTLFRTSGSEKKWILEGFRKIWILSWRHNSHGLKLSHWRGRRGGFERARISRNTVRVSPGSVLQMFLFVHNNNSLWHPSFRAIVHVLPVTSVGCNFKLIFLRAPEEFDDIIADLDVSARVVFFVNLLFQNFPSGRQNLIFKIGMFELILQPRKIFHRFIFFGNWFIKS